MAIDKPHWLPIHSLILTFDQLDCRPIFSMLTVVKTFCLDSRASLCQVVLYLWLVKLKFLYVFDCICKYFSNTDYISNTNMRPSVIFKYKMLLYKYIFKPNPGPRCVDHGATSFPKICVQTSISLTTGCHHITSKLHFV